MMKSASDNAKKQCDPCYYTSRFCSVLCEVFTSFVLAFVLEVQCFLSLYLYLCEIIRVCVLGICIQISNLYCQQSVVRGAVTNTVFVFVFYLYCQQRSVVRGAVTMGKLQ